MDSPPNRRLCYAAHLKHLWSAAHSRRLLTISAGKKQLKTWCFAFAFWRFSFGNCRYSRQPNMYLYVGITPQTKHASWILGPPGGFGQPVGIFGNNSESPRHSGIAKKLWFHIQDIFQIFPGSVSWWLSVFSLLASWSCPSWIGWNTKVAKTTLAANNIAQIQNINT